MIRRRDFITLLGSAAAVFPLSARAQQGSGRAAALLSRILQLRANSTADTLAQFIDELIRQIGWTVQLPWSAGTIERRRFDALLLLRQLPAVTELALLDASGHQQLLVSRLDKDVVGSNLDLSTDPKFTEAVAHKVYYGPVYLAHQPNIYMVLSLAGTRRDNGVSVAEVSLKLMWDAISQLKVGENGVAYVLDAQDRVIAHSAMFMPALDGERAAYHVDFSVFQRDLSGLAQVQAARAAGSSATTQAHVARDINGRDVLAASASVAGPGWHVFVELPLAEADTAVP